MSGCELLLPYTINMHSHLVYVLGVCLLSRHIYSVCQRNTWNNGYSCKTYGTKILNKPFLEELQTRAREKKLSSTSLAHV